MKEGRPSRTAIGVAIWRGLGGRDPLAKQLVPAPYGALLRAAELFGPVTAVAWRLAHALSLGLAAHLPLRTRAIDEAINAEWPRGTRQLVLLGAGLDARAYRLDEVAPVTVYEVDFPATQAYKQRAVEGVASKARALRYVAIDFQRESLSERLLAEGYEPTQPAVFIWEGVTMYLSPDAIEATLAALAGLAAPGSLLAVTYQTLGMPVLSRIAALGFAAAGEPLAHRIDPADFAAQLARHGFVLERDAGDREWSAQWGEPRVWLAMTERLALARRI